MKRKTINLITSHFYPEISPCTNRLIPYIKELEKSYHINIITLTEKGVFIKDKEQNFSHNSKIYYIDQKKVNSKNFILRAIVEWYYSFKLVFKSNQIESDLIFATIPYMFIIPTLAFLNKKKKILDCRDLVWEYLDDKSFIKKTIKSLIKKLMLFSMKKYSSVIVTNQSEYNILSKDIYSNSLYILPNGIELSRFEILSNLEYIQNNNFEVTYIGNIGIAQNLTILLEVAKELKDIKFNIIGSGVEFNDLKQFALDNQLENVNFTGRLEWKELKIYYEKSSVLYTQLSDNFISAVPSKIYEYLATGLPLIYGGEGEASVFLKNFENVENIQSDNKDLLVKAILKVKSKNYNRSLSNKKNIEENYIRETISKKLHQIIT